jgi:hypothetical protein
MRLMGRRDLTWVYIFVGLGISTTLICLQLMGMYPKAKLTLSNIKKFLANTENPFCSIMGIIPSMPGDLCG